MTGTMKTWPADHDPDHLGMGMGACTCMCSACADVVNGFCRCPDCMHLLADHEND